MLDDVMPDEKPSKASHSGLRFAKLTSSTTLTVLAVAEVAWTQGVYSKDEFDKNMCSKGCSGRAKGKMGECFKTRRT